MIGAKNIAIAHAFISNTRKNDDGRSIIRSPHFVIFRGFIPRLHLEWKYCSHGCTRFRLQSIRTLRLCGI